VRVAVQEQKEPLEVYEQEAEQQLLPVDSQFQQLVEQEQY